MISCPCFRNQGDKKILLFGAPLQLALSSNSPLPLLLSAEKKRREGAESALARLYIDRQFLMSAVAALRTALLAWLPRQQGLLSSAAILVHYSDPDA